MRLSLFRERITNYSIRGYDRDNFFKYLFRIFIGVQHSLFVAAYNSIQKRTCIRFDGQTFELFVLFRHFSFLLLERSTANVRKLRLTPSNSIHLRSIPLVYEILGSSFKPRTNNGLKFVRFSKKRSNMSPRFPFRRY